MAASKGNKNAIGKHRGINDRTKAAHVRNLLLDEIDKILSNFPKTEEEKTYRKEIVLRMCGTLLPRLNAGRDDEERLFPEPLLGGKTKNGISNNKSSGKTAPNEKKD